LTSEQIRAARAMLRIQQRELSRKAGVSLETVKRIERTPGPISAYTTTVESLRYALEEAGIEFIDGDRPGVRMKTAADVGRGEPGSSDD
jgi:predicted transcriptional regulator